MPGPGRAPADVLKIQLAASGTMQPDGAQTFIALHRATTEPKGRFVTQVTYTDAQGRTRTCRP